MVDVTLYGVIGDGVADDTVAFQAAIDAAAASDDPRVLVPNGLQLTLSSTVYIKTVVIIAAGEICECFRCQKTFVSSSGPRELCDVCRDWK